MTGPSNPVTITYSRVYNLPLPGKLFCIRSSSLYNPQDNIAEGKVYRWTVSDEAHALQEACCLQAQHSMSRTSLRLNQQ